MHEHEHDHDHAHHCHPHSHEHSGDKPMSPEEVLALLNYMLDHNRHHADELHDICHALEDEGKAEADTGGRRTGCIQDRSGRGAG